MSTLPATMHGKPLLNAGFSLLIPSLLLLLAACQSPDTKPQERPSEVTTPFPVVQDTTAGTSSRLFAKWRTRTKHPIFYLGPYRDTLTIGYALSAAPPPPLPDDTPQVAELAAYARYIESNSPPAHWQQSSSAQLPLTLDTTVHLKGLDVYRANEVEDGWDSYPVLVHNAETDTVVVGYGDFIPLQVEAKDAQGDWRLIEQPYAYYCGVGVPIVFLPPHQVVLTSVFIPHGSFRTQLRLRLGKNFSAAFRGSIEIQQFEPQP